MKKVIIYFLIFFTIGCLTYIKRTERMKNIMPLQSKISQINIKEAIVTSNFSETYWAYTPLKRIVYNIEIDCNEGEKKCIENWINRVFEKANYLLFTIKNQVKTDCSSRIKGFWKKTGTEQLKLCREKKSSILLSLILEKRFDIIYNDNNSFMVKKNADYFQNDGEN